MTELMMICEGLGFMKCKICGSEMIQKSRFRLGIVGVFMTATIAIPFYYPLFWLPALVMFLAGAYLLVWATLGRGGWCRTCKKFST